MVKVLGSEILEIIESVGFDFSWNVRKVWVLDVSTDIEKPKHAKVVL